MSLHENMRMHSCCGRDGVEVEANMRSRRVSARPEVDGRSSSLRPRRIPLSIIIHIWPRKRAVDRRAFIAPSIYSYSYTPCHRPFLAAVAP